jgi:hypothetical protein
MILLKTYSGGCTLIYTIVELRSLVPVFSTAAQVPATTCGSLGGPSAGTVTVGGTVPRWHRDSDGHRASVGLVAVSA